jgi:tetratricopeptide (TPR) repeat protein
MADLEVENTLREIRERVLADAQRREPLPGGEHALATSGANGLSVNGHASNAGDALARMDANLATTGRAWSRLPPVLTYRRGAAARLELWLKRMIKRAAHWFTWEQVNFNSAVHHALGDVRAALGDVRAALAAHDKALARTREESDELREELLGELRTQRAEAEADRARAVELQARLAHAEARFDAGAAQLRQAFAAGLERLAEALREEQRAETTARAAELQTEMRERVDGLLEEQRVCFKQLSLEAGEAAVMQDRARHRMEARIEALETKEKS